MMHALRPSEDSRTTDTDADVLLNDEHASSLDMQEGSLQGNMRKLALRLLNHMCIAFNMGGFGCL